MIGQQFNSLFVVSEAPRKHKNRARYLCRCACGNETTVDAYHLRSGHTSSCGCVKLQMLVSRLKTHGKSGQPEYRSWSEAKSRCTNPNNRAYKHYGGRGIRFCERWASFSVFLKDMGPRPQGCSLDRIDVNGNYEPNNCRWATEEQQQNNRRNNRLFEYQGGYFSITQLSRMVGIPQSNLHRWIVKEGKDLKSVLASR